MNPLIMQAHSCKFKKEANPTSNCNIYLYSPHIRGISNYDHKLPTCKSSYMRLSNPNYGKVNHSTGKYRETWSHHQRLLAAASSSFNANCKDLLKYSASHYSNHKYCKGFTDSKDKISAKALEFDNNAEATVNYAQLNPFSAVLKDKTSPSAPGDSESKGLIEWEGSVLLEKQNFLDLSNIVADISDKFSELLGSRVYLQLVSSTSTDPESNEGRRSERAYLEDWFQTASTLRADEGTNYKVRFKVDKEFGTPGAILVENEHPNPFFLRSVSLTNTITGSEPIKFSCNSWIYQPGLSNGSRIFFTNQCYLPGETPLGIHKLRCLELENKRGDGKGERVTTDRIYEYAVYNDLGNPDKGTQYARNVLGGSVEFPYPRRCRTGRQSTATDPGAESTLNITGNVYVPRDEQFGRVKLSDFFGSALKAVLHALLPTLRSLLSFNCDFQSFETVHDLYSRTSIQSLREKIKAPSDLDSQRPLELFRQLTDPRGGDTNFFKFPVPQIIQVNERVWCDDSEFGRQLLVGVNPVVIQRLTVFPPTSNLDPNLYGPTLSSITAKHIEGSLEGLTVDEALREKRLYTLDYHDVYMPYIERINKLKGKAYASRSLFFLTCKGTLNPLAIELSLPPYDGKPPTNEVLVPPPRGQRDPLWDLAKLHVILNDTGYHELVSHWLRSHCAMEPFIIATHRQLSAMHPMFCLLVPHFKNTMNINATARNDLINSFSGSLINGGIIEYGFSPGRYSMELSSAAYKQWRFDEQALPIDLVKRGMAEPDSTKKHGLRLHIEDYPFAVDALEIWAALSEWAKEYVNIFYEDDAAVKKDAELHAWWWEVQHKGHADKAHEEWWPKLTGRAELANVATTLMWIASGHHAGVNFGQYGYGGFPPSRPTLGRQLLPEKDSDEYGELLKNPGKFYLQSMSSVFHSVLVIATLEILSNHAYNEEYLGQEVAYEGVVASSARVRMALKKFQERLKAAEEDMKKRNRDPSLENRCGKAGILYTILLPSSPTPGLSGRGIPNSISI